MDFISLCIGISDCQKKQYTSTSNSNVGIRDYLVDYKVKLSGRFIRPGRKETI